MDERMRRHFFARGVLKKSSVLDNLKPSYKKLDLHKNPS